MTRKFQDSHPWISFEADLRRVEHRTWVLLGETQSKCLHISNVPMKPELSRMLHETYLAKGIHGTTAIEGNTLSEEEVRQRIEGKLALPESRKYLGQEVDNILEGYNLVRAKLLEGDSGNVDSDEIKNYNKIILGNLQVPDHVVPGEIRTESVGVLNYRGAPAEDCDYLLSKLCDWLNDPTFYPRENRIVFGVVRAIIAHLYLAWIHPFGDGNGRTARLVELKLMLASGAPVPTCHLLSNHYNRTREEYYRQLDYASKSGGDIFRFLHYAAQGLADELQAQLNYIHAEQLQIFWRDYVYEKFGSEAGKIAQRRRRLALDLSREIDPIPADEIREVTAKVAEAYAGKTQRTIERDLKALEEMELVVREGKGFLANLRLLSQFYAPSRRVVAEESAD